MYVSTEVTLEPYINVDGAVEFCSELPYRDIVQEVDAADDAAHSNKEEFPRGPFTVDITNAVHVHVSVYHETTLAQIQTDAILCKQHATQSDISNHFTSVSGIR